MNKKHSPQQKPKRTELVDPQQKPPQRIEYKAPRQDRPRCEAKGKP